MSSYYYLAASLPLLRIDEHGPCSDAEFMALCARHLSRSDYAILAKADLDARCTTAPHRFLAAWNSFRKAVGVLLVEERARRLKLDSEHYKSGSMHDGESAEVVRSVLTAEHPLQAESLLLEACWNKIESLAVNHTFDIVFLLAYRLKLQILERKDLFTPLEGNAEFKRLFSNLQMNIKSL